MVHLIRFKKIILAIILFVLALFLLEMMLRLGGVLYLNLRYPTKPVKADSQGFNILCLGDSYTQGFGAPFGRSYPEQLQELLKKQTNKNIAVYKEFRINSSTILKYLEKDINTYNPGLIIIMTGGNDRWTMDNCSAAAFEDGSFSEKIDIACSGLRVYKLVKISFLNLRSFITKQDLKSIQEENIEKTPIHFCIPQAEEHFYLGEQHMYNGEYELALNEFNIAERLEPQNPWVHWRKACIYIQVIKEPVLGERELKLALRYGDSSIVGHVFLLYGYIDDGKVDATIKEMDSIIDAKYKGRDKIKAKKYLRRLYLLNSEKKWVEKVVAYNLKEIIKIIKGKNIKVILMNYPDGIVPHTKMIIEKAGMLFNTIVIDNQKIFADKLKILRRVNLFIGDGHCNANGYKLIAENLAKVLIQERMFDDPGNRRP